jgi:hypothetical protein
MSVYCGSSTHDVRTSATEDILYGLHSGRDSYRKVGSLSFLIDSTHESRVPIRPVFPGTVPFFIQMSRVNFKCPSFSKYPSGIFFIAFLQSTQVT